MSEDVCFSYRLPLTFVRVTGTRSETSDLDSMVAVECKSAITTEVGADTRSRFPIRLGAEAAATQKASWILTADGRLSGADVTTTVERFAGLSAALQAGSTALALAGPPLIAAGPLGWAALAGVVGVTGLGAAALADRSLLFTPEHDTLDIRGREDEPSNAPVDADPADWEVHARYVQAHQDDAIELANLRSTLATAARKHAQAAHASAFAEASSDRTSWASRMTQLQWLLRATIVGANRAEAKYAAWVAATVKSVTSSHDFRLRIEQLPTHAEFVEWAGSNKRLVAYPVWWELLDQLQLMITVDMEQIEGDNDLSVRDEYTSLETSETVHYRPPRPATLRVWKARLPSAGDKVRRKIELVETRREYVNRPGNETTIDINTDHHTTNAVKVSFDGSGALTGITTELKDPGLQRASDITGLISKVSESVTAGHDIREAISPPSYVDRAAEAKAIAELGLTPSQKDPLKELKDQVAEQQLRAQLKLAQQMQAAGSVPIFVSVSQPS